MTLHRLALSGRLAEELAARLAEALPELETRVVAEGALAAADLAWADSYAGFALPENVAASRIRWVHLMTAGVDSTVPTLRAVEPLPLLTRTVGTMPQKIGAYVLGHVLAEFLRLETLREQQAERRWEPIAARPHVGQTAVVLGAGRVGAGIAAALRGVGFRVVGVSRSGAAYGPFDAVVTPDDAPAEYARCVALVCALPLTAETRHAVDASILGLLHDAVVVNVGRGATIAEPDLREALEAGRVRRAVLDVFETEPLPPDSWMWAHERVTVTPHIAGITDVDDVLGDLVEAYVAIRSGLEPKGRVSLERGY